MKNEALRLALEALQYNDHLRGEAITAIKQALEQPDHSCIACEGNPKGKNNPCNVCGLAQPEPEPDYYGLTADHLWMSISKDHYDRLKPEYRMACYTSQPKREWQGLTDDKYEALVEDLSEWSRYVEVDTAHQTLEKHIREVLTAHGIKGEA